MSDEAPVRVFRMSELTPPTEQCGTGSLLLIGEGQKRMPSGAPYQPAFWFGEQSIILGLVTDDEAHPLGYAEADLPQRWEDTEFISLPDGIAEQARTWFHGQQL